MTISLNLYHTMALAVIVFYLGSVLKKRIAFFQTYCIPSPVIGGIVFALLQFSLFELNLLNLTLDTSLQSVFMNLFFTSVGFSASISMVKKGGKTLIVFMAVVAVLIVLQNTAGALLCHFFDLPPLLGLALGSLPLTGGHGTSAAFAPLLEDMGISNALTVAIAAATYGLIAGNLIGNPVARKRIVSRHLLTSSSGFKNEEAKAELEKNTHFRQTLDPERGTWALALLFLASGAGTFITYFFNQIHLTMASYVGSMIIGILIRNISDSQGQNIPVPEISTIGSICLNFFLALAMMGLKLQQLAGLALPMLVILLIQTGICAAFCYFITFSCCGRDYDAAVLSSGHCGFGMGATPNAMANMDSLTKVYGPSEKAYLIIPICGGFFTDIVNSLIITLFMNLL